MMGDRGVATTLNYALTLGVMTLLITGLLVAAGGTVEDQRERTIRTELQVVGQQLAADVQAADRFVAAGDEEFSIRHELPNSIVGTSYRIQVVVDDPGNSPPRETYLRLTTSDPDVTVEIDVVLSVAIEETTTNGGPVEVTYDSGAGALEVTDDG